MLKPCKTILNAYRILNINSKPCCAPVPLNQGSSQKFDNNKQFYGTMKQIPEERISYSKIISNISELNFTLKLLNNMKIAVDCTMIALKYSKCYMCRLPLIKQPIRKFYLSDINQEENENISKLFLSQCPVPEAKDIFKRFKYENKGLYAALSTLLQPDNLTGEQYDNVIKFMTALQLVNLGFSLHHSIGKSYRLNYMTRIALKLMSKQLKDSYLVLGGDYFHIKGSVLAAETGKVQLSEILSEVQIDLCKYVHLTDQLKNKIVEKGYDTISVKEIYDISILKTSPFVKGLMSMDVIQEKKTSSERKQAYQCLSLLVLYRKDLQNFIFNFKQIVKKYGEYITNRLNFDLEQSLPYYIFFQGVHNGHRIDLAYLNTVKMMSDEIAYLETRIGQIFGEQTSEKLMKRMNYYLMVYS